MEHTIVLTFDTVTKKPYRLRIAGAKENATVAEIKAVGDLFVAHDPFMNGVTRLASAELQNSSESPFVL